MPTSINIKAILDAAVQREDEAHAFYLRISKGQSNATVKQTFAELAADELSHKEFLQACLRDPALLSKMPTPKDYKVAEATEEPAFSIAMKPAEALALAMKKEEGAARFYRNLAESTSDPVLATMFTNLARMELGHKTRIETLFVNIGYPEVF